MLKVENITQDGGREKGEDCPGLHVKLDFQFGKSKSYSFSEFKETDACSKIRKYLIIKIYFIITK